MPRTARRIFPDIPHHIVQRGNGRRDVFFSDADRRTYLDWLGEYSALHQTRILAYCLMTNHVHLVAVPGGAASFEGLFRSLHTRYALRVNRLKGRCGHVWQGRPFAAPLDEAYLYAAVRYTELNPVRAGMVARATDYGWSSAAAHCGLRRDPLLAPADSWLPDVADAVSWSEWLARGDAPDELAVLRENSRRARPCGSEAFVSDLERRAGRPLRAGKRGRPRRASDDQ